LLSFVPQHVAADILAHPAENQVGREQRFRAIALFADISGFTAMSEALSKAGRAGAEELTGILNGYFAPMIELIESYGGIVGKFGGDALTALFPYTTQNRAAAARRAIQCALDMQARMPRYAAIPTSAGAFSLAMRAGLAIGSVYCASVGDPAIRLEYIIAGGLLDRCAEAEHVARTGEVVIHIDLLPFAGEAETVAAQPRFARVRRLDRRVPRSPLAAPSVPPPIDGIITAYLHPSIVQRLTAGQIGFVNEHRKVTIIFVQFSGFDYDDDPSVGARLQSYLVEVIRCVQRYDGHLLQADMDDKGSKYIVLFGAPVAHENDQERALRCVLDLRDAARAAGVATRTGVNSGYVYCGQIGGPMRQAYTAMGDAVNLAARLMQAARSEQILVSDFTRRAVAGRYAWERLAPIQVKGKAEPISLYALAGIPRRSQARLHEPAYSLPMVGRAAEVGRVADLLAQALDNHGQIVGITAEAGMGKSRLAAELMRLAHDRGLTSLSGECVSYGSTTSYLVWHSILRGLFELDLSWSAKAQERHLLRHLAALDRQYAQRASLLGMALNLPIAENDLTRSMDAKARKELLESLVIEYLLHRARSTPLLLVLEDCHWIDPLSNDLLEAICGVIADAPVLVLMIYRPPETERIKADRISRLAHFSELRLQEFIPEEARCLIELKLAQLFGSDEVASPALAERITERAQGNPFYIDEMINLIRDRGLDPTDARAAHALELPDSLHSLIISRIDQLEEGAKTTLKVASVIGRLFKASWLWGIYPQLGTPDRVRDHLTTLNRLDLTPLDKPEPELEYLFKHIVTREVAYESLSLATRAMLHEQTGLFIERTYPNERELWLDLLAYHFGASQNQEKQRVYFRAAAEAAQAAYANETAIEYYQRLLPLLPEPDQIGVMLTIGEIRQLIGAWAAAEAIIRLALALAEQRADPRAEAQCRTALGRFLWHKGTYREALASLEQARAAWLALGDRQGASQAVWVIGIIHVEHGDYTPALACFQQTLETATELGDRRLAGTAIGHMGLAYIDMGEHAKALECLEQWVLIAREFGDHAGVCRATGNIGFVYMEQQEYARALPFLRSMLHVAMQSGNRMFMAKGAKEIGKIYLNHGDTERALKCYAYHLATSLDLGDLRDIGVGLGYILAAYIAQARYAEAERVGALALAQCRALNVPYWLCEDLYSAADLFARQARFAEAAAYNDEALALAAQIGGRKDIQFKAHLLAIRLRVVSSQADAPAAIGALERMLGDCPTDHERAAIFYELWRLDAPGAARLATDLYRDLYERTPTAEYKERYEAVASAGLPNLPTLPELPDVIMRALLDLEALLERVERIIAESYAP
ncbi:MAG TPA: adenylate/guanylate cyclase domain-containing protein, partial [Roseiflexaceae bacterium]